MFLFLFDLVMIQEIFFVCKFKKRLSPFLLIAIPYVVVINLNNLIINFVYGYHCVSNIALFKLCLFLSIVFVIELFVNFLYSKITIKQKQSVFEKSNDSLVFILFFIGLSAYLLQFILNVSILGFSNIKGTSSGILGHLSFLFFILAPLYFFKMIKRVNKVIASIPMCIGMFIAVLFGGKYVIMIGITYWLISYILFKHLSVKEILKICILLISFALLVFLAIYTVKPLITNSNKDRSFGRLIVLTIEHFFHYLCAPVIGNNIALTSVGEDLSFIPHTVPINIVKAIIRDQNYVNPIFGFMFDWSNDSSSNVAGLFGELHYCIGSWAFLYVAIMFSAIEMFWNYSIKSNKFFLTRCYLASVIAFLFFCNFFTVSGVVLPLIYVAIVEGLLPFIPTNVSFNPLKLIKRKNKGDGR